MITRKNKILLKNIMHNTQVLKMKQYLQHGNINTYEHCVHVTIMSLKIAEKLKLTEAQIHNIIIGAMLHDFYLYDWHTGRFRKEGIHGFIHPKIALQNANKYFHLNKKQQNIITAHMFPLTLLHIPLCKEAWIVNIADTMIAIIEYIQSIYHTQKLSIQ